MSYVILGLLGVVIFHLPDLMREDWGERLAFGALCLLAGVYASLVALDFDIPTVTELIEGSITSLYRYLDINW